MQSDSLIVHRAKEATELLAKDMRLSKGSIESVRLKKRRNSTRDSQRRKVYRWERSTGILQEAHQPDSIRYINGGTITRVFQPGFSGNEPLTPAECRVLMDYIWRAYYPDRPAPKLRLPTHYKPAWGTYRKLSLPPWARHPSVIVHEMTHALLHQFEHDNDLDYAAHGPEFVRMYARLLAEFLGYDEEEVLDSAILAGVEYTSTENLPRRQVSWDTTLLSLTLTTLPTLRNAVV